MFIFAPTLNQQFPSCTYIRTGVALCCEYHKEKHQHPLTVAPNELSTHLDYCVCCV